VDDDDVARERDRRQVGGVEQQPRVAGPCRQDELLPGVTGTVAERCRRPDDLVGPDLWQARRELVERALGEASGAPVEEAIERFVEARPDAMRRLEGFARTISVEGTADLAGLTLAVRQLRALAN
jgi:hypothetical protein